MSGTKTADVIVIGSGIVGSSTAYYCTKRGLSVIVLDKDIIGNGASCRCGGGVRASSRDAREIPLAKYAIENLWPMLAEELDTDIEYHQGGNLRFAIGEKEVAWLEQLMYNSAKSGLSIRMLNAKETHELCPFVTADVTCAAFCPNDGHANPLKTTLGMYRRNRALGVRYFTGEEAVELQKSRGRVRRVVSARGNTYEADHVVIAAGYSSRALLNTVGIDLPFRRKLIEMFVTEAAPRMFDFMISSTDGAFYGHQTDHGSFVFGGDSGLEHYPVLREEERTLQITAPAISRGVLQYFPTLADLKIIRTWAGWIDLTPDLVPCIGPAEEVPGLLMAAGYSAHGFCLGPVTGKIFSELICGVEPCSDITPLRYDRFKPRQ